MRLAEWLTKTGKKLEPFARACGFSTAAAGRYALHLRIPRKRHAIAIYRRTGGAVTPNDFYELPAIRRRRRA